MKKISMAILALAVVLTLAACGCQNSNKPTNTTGMTILPDMDNTIGTNIPDPDVDTSMPIYTEGTDTTDDSSMTDETVIPGITDGRRR